MKETHTVNSDRLILPDPSKCLICNTRPKAGSDDLCDACAWRLLLTQTTVRPLVLDPVHRAPRRDTAGALQDRAIRILEEECR
jgi:hypothetical protein